MEPDLRFSVDRKEFPITPEVFCPGENLFATDRLFNAVVVVDNLQRTKTGLAHMQRLLGILLAALSTFESFDKAHRLSFPFRLSKSPWMFHSIFHRPGIGDFGLSRWFGS